MMWECHVEDYDKCRYDMILGRYLLTELVSILKIPNISLNHVMEL